jgi:hypothetical protein
MYSQIYKTRSSAEHVAAERGDKIETFLLLDAGSEPDKTKPLSRFYLTTLKFVI